MFSRPRSELEFCALCTMLSFLHLLGTLQHPGICHKRSGVEVGGGGGGVPQWFSGLLQEALRVRKLFTESTRIVVLSRWFLSTAVDTKNEFLYCPVWQCWMLIKASVVVVPCVAVSRLCLCCSSLGCVFAVCGWLSLPPTQPFAQTRPLSGTGSCECCKLGAVVWSLCTAVNERAALATIYVNKSWYLINKITTNRGCGWGMKWERERAVRSTNLGLL